MHRWIAGTALVWNQSNTAAHAPQRSLLGESAGARGEDKMFRGGAVASSGPTVGQPQALAFIRGHDLWAQVAGKASSDVAPDTY